MHPLLRNIKAQVVDSRAAYSRFEDSMFPDGVPCPKCEDTICQRIYAHKAPPWEYECALCDHRFCSMDQSILSEDGDYLASWDEWLDILARTIAFGPRVQIGNSKADKVRRLCAEMVATRDDIAAHIFNILELPQVVQPLKDDGMHTSAKIHLPQPDASQVLF